MSISELKLRLLPDAIVTLPDPSCGNRKVIEQIAGDYPHLDLDIKLNLCPGGAKPLRERALEALEKSLKPEYIQKNRIRAFVFVAIGIISIAATVFGFVSFGAAGLFPLIFMFVPFVMFLLLDLDRFSDFCSLRIESLQEARSPEEEASLELAREKGLVDRTLGIPSFNASYYVFDFLSSLTRHSRLENIVTKYSRLENIRIKKLENATSQVQKFLKESQAFCAKNGQTILEKLDEAIAQKDTPVKRPDLEELKKVKAKAQEMIDFFKPFEGKEISLEFLETSPYYQIVTKEE